MIIAQGAAKEKVILPPAFREYMDIFSEKTSTKLLWPSWIISSEIIFQRAG